jgi:hypothetical protein
MNEEPIQRGRNAVNLSGDRFERSRRAAEVREGRIALYQELARRRLPLVPDASLGNKSDGASEASMDEHVHTANGASLPLTKGEGRGGGVFGAERQIHPLPNPPPS